MVYWWLDVFESFRRERRHDAGNLREEPVVFRGVRLAGALPIRKMAQFTRRIAAWISSRRLFQPGSLLRYFSA